MSRADAGPPRWGLMSQGLHWLSAFLLAAVLALGFHMSEFADDAARKFDLFQLHKTSGALIFPLTLLRLIWLFSGSRPPPAAALSRFERLASKSVHAALYLGIAALCLSGYAMVSASPLPLPVVLPGGVSLPNLLAPDFAASETYKAAHRWTAWAFTALMALHIGAALAHRYVRRDDVLARMLPWKSRGRPDGMA